MSIKHLSVQYAYGEVSIIVASTKMWAINVIVVVFYIMQCNICILYLVLHRYSSMSSCVIGHRHVLICSNSRPRLYWVAGLNSFPSIKQYVLKIVSARELWSNNRNLPQVSKKSHFITSLSSWCWNCYLNWSWNWYCSQKSFTVLQVTDWQISF